MRRASLIFAIIPLFVCVCAFRDAAAAGNQAPAVAVPCGDAKADLNVVTYNATIAPGAIRWATPRFPHVIEAIRGLDYDVICVQEVWRHNDAWNLIKALDLPPQNYSYVDTRGRNETGKSVCESDSLEGVAQCLRAQCGNVPEEDVSACVAEKCRLQLAFLLLFDGGCFNCLTSTVGNPFSEIMRICESPGKGASRVYGGGNGTILASRWPLLDKEYLELPSSGINRVALFARVEIPGKGSVQIACSNLSANQEIRPSHRDFRSWQDEQRAQLRLISDKLAARAKGGSSIFLGDMNFGPGIGSSVKEVSGESWKEALRLGFSSPAASASRPLCSTCGGNTLRNWSESYLLDHVMYRDTPGGATLEPVCAERVLDGAIPVTAYGKTSVSNLSDHYGIRVKFRIR